MDRWVFGYATYVASSNFPHEQRSKPLLVDDGMRLYIHRTYNLFIHFFTYISIYYTTSSTAQGGGGSFKNPKPIGEIGCCESRISERIH